MKALQDSVHRLLAKSRVVATVAVKIRNQANCIIAYHLGESADATLNGEFCLIECLTPQISTFIDVGANVGNWSEHILKHTKCQGFLFEPSQQCVKRLEERFHDCDVVIRQVAVSDYAGKAQFAEEDNFGERSALVDAREDESGQRKEVLVTTLDTEFSESSQTIDYLKIDTEGYDFKVLRGATALLARTRFVQFEYSSSWVSVGSSLYEATQFLKNLGFSTFLIRSTGLHPLRYDLWSDYFRYSNYFACRPSDYEHIRHLLQEPI